MVATQSGDGMKLYVDGALVGTHPQTAGRGLHGLLEDRWRRHLGSSSAYFDGTIDEVAVYLSELAPQRIAAHFDGRLRGAQPDCLWHRSTTSPTA